MYATFSIEPVQSLQVNTVPRLRLVCRTTDTIFFLSVVEEVWKGSCHRGGVVIVVQQSCWRTIIYREGYFTPNSSWNATIIFCCCNSNLMKSRIIKFHFIFRYSNEAIKKFKILRWQNYRIPLGFMWLKGSFRFRVFVRLFGMTYEIPGHLTEGLRLVIRPVFFPISIRVITWCRGMKNLSSFLVSVDTSRLPC